MISTSDTLPDQDSPNSGKVCGLPMPDFYAKQKTGRHILSSGWIAGCCEQASDDHEGSHDNPLPLTRGIRLLACLKAVVPHEGRCAR